MSNFSKILINTLLFFSTAISMHAQVFDKRITWNTGPATFYFSDIKACATRSNGHNLISIHRYNYGQGAGMLAEITNNGDTVWTNQFNRSGTSYGEDYITFIKELPNHTIFMAGGTHNSSGFFHAAFFLADSLGQIIHYKKVHYGSNLDIVINDIDVASDGTIFFAGHYNDLYSGGVTGYSWTVPLYGRLNSDLSINWCRTYGSTSHTFNNTNSGKVASIKVTPDNNLVIAGTDAVDPNDGYLGTFQLAKVTTNGALMWSVQRSLTTHSYPTALKVLSNGDIYAFSEVYYLSPFGDYDISLEKFDQYGNYLWGKSYGTTLSDNMSRVVYNSAKQQFALVGTHTISATEDRAWLCILDTAGQVIHNKLFGAPSSHYNNFNDICVYKNLYLITGNAFTYEGMLVQTDWDGNTGCAPSTFSLQTAVFPSVFTAGLSFHNTLPLQITPYTAVKVNYPLTSTTNCFACSDVSINQTISACGSYYIGGGLQTNSGTYFDTLLTSGGCDSIVITQLSISQTPTPANAGIDQTVCATAAALSANVPVVGTGNWSVVSGTGSILNTAAAATGINGLTAGSTTTLRWTISSGACPPSTDEVTLQIGSPSTTSINTSACVSYTLNSQTYTSSGSYSQTFTNTSGCDSIINLNLTIYQPNTSQTTTSICSTNLPYVWNGLSILSAGSYSDTLVNSNGCDSIAQLNLQVKNATYSSTSVSVCNTDLPFNWNGNSYTTAGSYTANFINSVGCDSIATLVLTLKNATSSTTTANVCSADLPYLWGGNSYTGSGTYTLNYTNAAGCDSTANLNLSVNTIDLSVTNTDPVLTSNQSGASYQWINCSTNLPIANQTNASFTALTNGTYAVVVYYSGCHDTSACETVINTAISTVTAEQELIFYPNPVEHELNIMIGSEMKQARFSISNKFGQVLLAGSLSNTNNVLYLDELSNGIYTLTVYTISNQKTYKLVKK